MVYCRCILYEIAVGEPPFYTNNIFQLVNQIANDPVKWPPDMDPEFRSFLQGCVERSTVQVMLGVVQYCFRSVRTADECTELSVGRDEPSQRAAGACCAQIVYVGITNRRLLTKNPKKRLAWPAVSEHAFISCKSTRRLPTTTTLTVPGQSPSKRSPRKTAPRKPSKTPGRKPILEPDSGRPSRGAEEANSKNRARSKAKSKSTRPIDNGKSNANPISDFIAPRSPGAVAQNAEAGPAAFMSQDTPDAGSGLQPEVEGGKSNINRVHQELAPSPTCPELVALATQYYPALPEGVDLTDSQAGKQLRAVVSAHLTCTSIPMPGFTHDDLRSAFLARCSIQVTPSDALLHEHRESDVQVPDLDVWCSGYFAGARCGDQWATVRNRIVRSWA